MEWICELFEDNEPHILGFVAGPITIKDEQTKEDSHKQVFALCLIFFQVGIVW